MKFKEEKQITKQKRKHTFRIIGVVVPSVKEIDKIIGYAILEMGGYTTKVFTRENTFALMERYDFINAEKVVEKGAVKIKNTETKAESADTSMQKMMIFNTEGRVIGRPGITILAQIEGYDEKKFKIIDARGRVVDISEDDLLEIINTGNKENPMRLINGSVVRKSGGKGYIASLKDGFPVIVRDKKEVPEVKDENKEIYLQKIRNKFRVSVISRYNFDNWNVEVLQEEGKVEGGKTQVKKFKKALDIYEKEYASIKHPKVVKETNKLYSDSDVTDTMRKLTIVKVCTLIECFDANILPVKHAMNSYTIQSLYAMYIADSKFATVLKKTGGKETNSLYNIIKAEVLYYIYKKKDGNNNTSTGMNRGTLYIYKEFQEEILNDLMLKEGDRFNLLVKQVKQEIDNTSSYTLLDYVQRLPIVFTLKKYDVEAIKKAKRIVNFTFKSAKDITELGYCVKADDRGKVVETLYGGKPLKYIYEGLDLTKEEQKEIASRATCFGDVFLTAQLLRVQENGYTGVKENESRWSDIDFKLNEIDIELKSKVYKEAVMIMMAIYNMDLAMYLNSKYNLVDLDLNTIGHEDFNLAPSSKVFYQSGGKFNKSEVKKGTNWSGLSIIPQDLKTALVLYSSEDIDTTLENIYSRLYRV